MQRTHHQMVAVETLVTAHEIARNNANRTLPFDIPHHSGHTVLWRNPDHHVNVSGQQMAFDDFTLALFGQLWTIGTS